MAIIILSFSCGAIADMNDNFMLLDVSLEFSGFEQSNRTIGLVHHAASTVLEVLNKELVLDDSSGTKISSSPDLRTVLIDFKVLVPRNVPDNSVDELFKSSDIVRIDQSFGPLSMQEYDARAPITGSRPSLNLLILGDLDQAEQKDAVSHALQHYVNNHSISMPTAVFLVTECSLINEYDMARDIQGATQTATPLYFISAMSTNEVLGNTNTESGSGQFQLFRTTGGSAKTSVNSNQIFAMAGGGYVEVVFTGLGHGTSSVDSGSALAELQRTLADIRSKDLQPTWLLVVGQYPVYSVGEFEDLDLFGSSISQALSKYGVDAYICGQGHTSEHLSGGDVDFFVVGEGSAASGAAAARSSHADTSAIVEWTSSAGNAFLSLDATAAALTVLFVNVTGAVTYSYSREFEPHDSSSWSSPSSHNSGSNGQWTSKSESESGDETTSLLVKALIALACVCSLVVATSTADEYFKSLAVRNAEMSKSSSSKALFRDGVDSEIGDETHHGVLSAVL